MLLKVYTVDAMCEESDEFERWTIINQEFTGEVIDLDSALNDIDEEVYDEEMLVEEVSHIYKFSQPTVWNEFDPEGLIHRISICDGMKPILECIREDGE